ncbi:MAG: LptE family protein [Acidobacteria bacterium]|nr:LptE family protein [Acidobacteriota bacterium]
MLLLVAAPSGCGYHVNSPVPASQALRTLAVPTLKNSTSVFQVEQRLTRALIEEFSRRSRYRVTSTESGADAAVRGEVVSVSAAPVIIGTESFGTTFLVTLNAHVSMVDLKTNRILFRNDNYVFREQYVINNDVEQFFSEINPALERMARDFAQSVAATVLAEN